MGLLALASSMLAIGDPRYENPFARLQDAEPRPATAVETFLEIPETIASGEFARLAMVGESRQPPHRPAREAAPHFAAQHIPSDSLGAPGVGPDRTTTRGAGTWRSTCRS